MAIDGYIFTNSFEAEGVRRKALKVVGVNEAFTYPVVIQGMLKGFRVFVAGLTDGYGSTAKPLTEDQVKGIRSLTA